MWTELDLEETSKHACLVDHAGETVLAHLLSQPAFTNVLGLGVIVLVIAVVTWYLWRELRKLDHGEKS